MVDGLESEPYQDVADLAFSPSGKNIAWTARKNDKWKVIKNGAESEPWDRVGPLFWSAKREALAYASGLGKEEWAVVDATAIGPYDGVMPESLTFNSQGAAVAFAARRGDAFWVVDPEGEKGPFESVEPPQFLGDSNATIFVARRAAATFWVVDGHHGPVLADATGLVLSATGRKLMILARWGSKTELVVANITGKECGEGRCSAAVERSVRHDVILGGTPAWSRAGEHFGYIAGNASSRLLMLMIDGRWKADIDVRELMAMLTIAPDLAGSFLGDSVVLAQWVKAELALVTGR
ncbi:MAG: hypothetical protein IPK82_16570 [Polyangiaceae bacterium]|nr:hypothetical protein [Polyangiaceae bacterium]